MQATSTNNGQAQAFVSSIDLTLVVHDPNVLSYLSQFEDDDVRNEKALEALKVGVIAIQSASPTLDTQVVQNKFHEVETRLKVQVDEFKQKVSDDLKLYFADRSGIFPRSLESTFGNTGTISQTFKSYFDPNNGSLSRLMQTQIGPESNFGKALDPRNREGIIALIETKVQALVETKLDEVLKQFSLDQKDTAMCRLKELLTSHLSMLNQSLGIKSAVATEAERGHVKGIEFEENLYRAFALTGQQLGDVTELVRGTVGTVSRSKKGDFIATLGETCGAHGTKIVIEVKDQKMRLRDAIDELKQAKENREAKYGILAFTPGNQPDEVDGFRRIGEDFFVTVDKVDLEAGKPMLFLDTAYKIARAMAVVETRKDEAGELDIQFVQNQLEGLSAWIDRINEMASKAKTIHNNGKFIEQTANELKLDLDNRINDILKMLRRTK